MKALDISTLKINPIELKQRLLGADDRRTLDIAATFENIIRKTAQCKYTFRETTIKSENDWVVFDFFDIYSRDLAKNLADCGSGFIVAVTLGHAIDRLLRQQAVKSSAEHFICDAVASALVEAACDKVQALLPTDTRPRFSPGYGDLPLSFQKPILDFLKSDSISLTESNLMIPTKSVTFIAGRKR